ncbi:MAG: YggS family pyridoxal phosphate enzyme [Gaiellales bacterium]
MNADLIRRNYEAIRKRAGEATVVAATKYVSVAELALLAEAGVEVVGENRVQELLAKHAAYGDAFRWHFIGRLQSNKANTVNRVCELVHAVDTDTTARRLMVPWLLEVNLSGEESKGGVPPDTIGEWVARYPTIRGLMTMPAPTGDPEDSRPVFRHLAALADSHGLAELSMGTSQDWEVAVEEGATFIRVGSALWSEV